MIRAGANSCVVEQRGRPIRPAFPTVGGARSITAFGMSSPDGLILLACTATRRALAVYGGRVLPLGLHFAEEAGRGQAEEADRRSDGPRRRVGPGAELLHCACGDG